MAIVAGAVLVAAAWAARAGVGAFGCLVVAMAAWWLAVLQQRRIGMGTVLVVAALARAAFLGSDFLSDDVHRFVWEGRVVLAGHNPYRLAPNDPALAGLGDPVALGVNHPYHASIYPPLAQAVFVAVAAAGLREQGFRTVMVLVDLLVVVGLLRWLQRRGACPGAAVVYAWSPVAGLAAGAGHLEPLLLLPLVAMAVAWQRQRPGWAGCWWAVATLVKVVPVLLLPWLLVRQPRRVLLVAAPLLLAAGWFLAAADVVGPLHHFATRYTFFASFAAWLAPWGSTGQVVLVVALVLFVGLVVQVQRDLARAGCAVLLGLLLAAPTVHFWYLAWPLPFAAAAWPAASARLALVWATVAIVLYPTYADSVQHGEFVAHRELQLLAYAVLAVAAGVFFVGAVRTRRRAVLAPRPELEPPAAFAVVIPSRGEVENLRELLPRWLAAGAVRVVVADSPTGDGTEAVVAGIAGAEYLRIEARGYGRALLAGLAAVRDVPLVVVADADHGAGPEQVRALLAPLADPGVALVTAARTGGAKLGLAQRLGNELVAGLLAIGFGRWYREFGPFAAFRSSAWPAGSLVDQGYGVNVERNVRALAAGRRAVEVALLAAPRRVGQNVISGTWRGVWRAADGMLRRLFALAREPWSPPSC